MTRHVLRLRALCGSDLARALFAVVVCHLVTLSPGHLVSRAEAHPVLADHHDRTLLIRVAPDHAAGQVVVTVFFRLEVNEFAAFHDLQPFKDRVPSGWQKSDPNKFYDGYAECYAPRLARWLDARGDGEPLVFTCTQHRHTLRDDNGQRLGHVRFDLVFRATFPLRPAQRQQFSLAEDEWLEWKGRIDLSLEPVGVQVLERTEPSAALKAKSPLDYQSGDYKQLRRVALTFEAPAAESGPKAEPAAAGDARPSPPSEPAPPGDDHVDLLRLFLYSNHAAWLLLLLAAAIGAVHALTPGHGKTLVAAYLVGQRGTVWHALVLGLVTTLTHTGGVLILAVVLQLFFSGEMSAETQRNVQKGLGLVMGLLVAGLGFWLLLQRLSGGADHIHIGGGHHHHHHGPGHHQHAPPGPVGWWGLVLMGMSGGIVPCWDAVAILLVAVARHEVWLALPMVLAFSAGLASVLVLIGVLVVRVRGFADSKFGEGRLVRALPLISAVCVLALGCWLCYASVKGIV